jgi:integrase
VVELVEVPSVAPRQTVPLTPAQAGTLLDVAEQHRNAGAYWLALGLGLRIGEILTLHWADVDLEVGTLTVQDSKTPAGQATLVIPVLVVAALKRHRTRQRRDQLKAVHWAEHDLVVCRQDGKPLGDAALRSQFKDHAQRAGLPPTTRFHDMRHSCAAFLIAKHVHQRVIMQVLRHSDIAITMNVYGHVLPEAQQEAAEAMNEVLAQVFRTGPAVDEENP